MQLKQAAENLDVDVQNFRPLIRSHLHAVESAKSSVCPSNFWSCAGMERPEPDPANYFPSRATTQKTVKQPGPSVPGTPRPASLQSSAKDTVKECASLFPTVQFRLEESMPCGECPRIPCAALGGHMASFTFPWLTELLMRGSSMYTESTHTTHVV